jgi:hypothetical protein
MSLNIGYHGAGGFHAGSEGTDLGGKLTSGPRGTDGHRGGLTPLEHARVKLHPQFPANFRSLDRGESKGDLSRVAFMAWGGCIVRNTA